MARVRMRHHISGGRQVDLENHSFTEWPEAGGILECGDGEAADLIRGGMADPVDAAPEITRLTEGWDDAPQGDSEILPVPAATPAARVRTEGAAGDETPKPRVPAQRRTAPRPRKPDMSFLDRDS